MGDFGEKSENSQVLDFLKNLDSRITRIEARLNISDSPGISDSEDNSSLEKKYNEPDAFESTMGEYWFANFGILIIAVGVVYIYLAKDSILSSEPENVVLKVTPPRVVFDLEAALAGTRLEDVESTIQGFFDTTDIDMLSADADDFIASIEDALAKREGA